MSHQYFKHSDNKNILFIFNHLARIKDINKLSDEDLDFFNNSNLRLINYINNHKNDDYIFEFSIEPLNYIEIINSFLLSENLTDDITKFIIDLITNFKENNIEKNSNFLSYIAKEKNSLIPLWN